MRNKETPKYMRVLEGGGAPPAAATAEAAPQAPAQPEALGRVRELLEPPAEFDADQREIWAELVSQTQGRLQVEDRWALSALVNAILLHRTASKKVKEIGSVIKSPSGYPIQNPYVSDMNKQAALILRFSAELGLTPAARTRGKVKKQRSNGPNPFANLKSLT